MNFVYEKLSISENGDSSDQNYSVLQKNCGLKFQVWSDFLVSRGIIIYWKLNISENTTRCEHFLSRFGSPFSFKIRSLQYNKAREWKLCVKLSKPMHVKRGILVTFQGLCRHFLSKLEFQRTIMKWIMDARESKLRVKLSKSVHHAFVKCGLASTTYCFPKFICGSSQCKYWNVEVCKDKMKRVKSIHAFCCWEWTECLHCCGNPEVIFRTFWSIFLVYLWNSCFKQCLYTYILSY